MLSAVLSVAPINLHGRDDRDQERLADLLGDVANLLGPGQRLRLLIDNRSVTARDELARLAARQVPRSRRQLEYTDRRRAWMEAKLSDARVARTAFYVIIGEQPRLGLNRVLSGAARRDSFRATVDEVGDRLEAMGLDYTVLDGDATRALLAGHGVLCPTPSQEALEGVYVAHGGTEEGEGGATSDAGQWERTLYALRVPDQTMPGWVGKLATLPFQSRVSIDIEGLNPDAELRRLDGLQTYIAGINDDRELQTGASSVQMNAQQREYRRVMDDMADPSVKIHKLGIYLTVTAATKEALAGNVARGAAALRSARCQVGWGLGDQARLRTATLPVVSEPGHNYRALTGTVGRCFPFNRLSPGHDTGMPLGRTPDKREQFLLDLDADDISTQQVMIAGVPGAGKSQLANELALQTFLEGNSVTVMDRSGSYRPLCRFLDGDEVVLLDALTQPAINPWDIMDAHQLIALHEEMVRDRLQMTPWQYERLERAIRLTLAEEEKPLERHLVARLGSMAASDGRQREMEDLIAALSAYVGDGEYATLADRHTSVDRANPFLLIDTRHLKGRAAVVAYRVVEALVEWRAAQHEGKKRPDGKAMLECMVIDEGWGVIEVAADYLEEIGRTSRHKNRRFVFATQNLSDALDSPRATKMFAAMPVVILFNVVDERAGQEAGLGWMGRTLRLTAREVEQLGGLKTIRGKHAQAFVIIRSEKASDRKRGRVDIEMNPDDIALFSSHKGERDERDAATRAYGGDLWQAVKSLVDGEKEAVAV